MTAIKSKKSAVSFSLVFIFNFILFAVKLYVGLSSNSISIYSDGINNLFDGISAAAGIICFIILSKGRDRSFDSRSEKTEQLLSLVLSAVILVSGFIFFFNSAERLMYPAPVWFTVSYFYVIAATAAVKLVMFFLLRRESRKSDSDVFRVMSLDSLMDFFITAVTLVTLFVSYKGGFSIDAYAGIVISILIMVSGLKSFREGLVAVSGFPDKETREKTEKLLLKYGIAENTEIEYSFINGKRAYVKTDAFPDEKALGELKKIVTEETGIELYLLK